MDPTARDFVKFVSSCTSSQAGLPKQAKEKALLFSQKLVSGSRWEARLETLWEHLLQSKFPSYQPSPNSRDSDPADRVWRGFQQC